MQSKMIKKKYILFFIILIGMLLILTGCSSSENTSENEVKTTTSNNANSDTNTSSSSENKQSEERVVDRVDYKAAAEKQMGMPEKGETVAIFHIKNYGDVKVKFFEEVAPKAVENFITHAKEGYYDGLTFHRVINEFMIQGGDPEGTGMGGESIWGTGFGTELAYELVPYRGSLCMAMSSLPNSIGSQFFITQAHYDEEMKSYLEAGGYPAELLEQYKEHGGYLSLYLQYTVFGQVYEGIEVVDAIAAVKTDDNDKPLENVIIESIEVTTY